MMAHSVWMNGGKGVEISCRTHLPEHESAVLLSNVHPCPVWVNAGIQRLHPSILHVNRPKPRGPFQVRYSYEAHSPWNTQPQYRWPIVK